MMFYKVNTVLGTRFGQNCTFVRIWGQCSYKSQDLDKCPVLLRLQQENTRKDAAHNFGARLPRFKSQFYHQPSDKYSSSVPQFPEAIKWGHQYPFLRVVVSINETHVKALEHYLTKEALSLTAAVTRKLPVPHYRFSGASGQ